MFSRVLRRTHMYLALFLFPWMLMYALSTLAMNHRVHLLGPAPAGSPVFAAEREIAYDAVFPPGTEPRTIARQILSSLDLDGAHSLSLRKNGVIVINRNDLITPRRLTYSPADRRLVIEKLPYRAGAFLERFHRRRGYAAGYGLDTAWAVSVDLVIVAMVGWVLSGLWMWWEMKVTRRLGALAIAGGLALFILYLSTL